MKMVKNLLFKLRNKLLMGDFRDYPYFNKNYRWSLYNFIDDILYGEKFRLKGFWTKYLSITKLFIVVSIVFLLGILIGLISSQSQINQLSLKNNKSTEVVDYFYQVNKMYEDSLLSIKEEKDSLMLYFQTREWKEYVIYKESNINIPDYLPDSIFFIMERERAKNKIPNSIFWRLIQKESSFRMIVNKNSGACGYMQVMPSTFNYLSDLVGICDMNIPENNIIMGSFILRRNYDRLKKKGFDEKKSWELALSGYNAGMGRVVQYGYNIPDIKETKDYVSYILKNFKS